MLVGVICSYDNTMQPFSECIAAHEQGKGKRNCHCPTTVLKLMRDNNINRKHAGFSASMMTNCARGFALQEKYDYYESVESGYNKARGEWVHAMIEADQTPRPGLIRERRIAKDLIVDGVPRRITGKPDEVDSKRGLLIDYKSKHLLPKKTDEKHEVQFNIYIWLLAGGYLLNETDGTFDEQVNIKIKGGGMHYLTWNTKPATLWKKVPYPIWEHERTEALLTERLRPFIVWREKEELPECNAFTIYSKRWECDCIKAEKQLNERGVYI